MDAYLKTYCVLASSQLIVKSKSAEAGEQYSNNETDCNNIAAIIAFLNFFINYTLSFKIRLLKLYDVIKKFNFDRAIVSKDGKYGVIDTRGRLVIPCDYFYIQDFQDSLSIVSKLVTKYKGKVKHEYAVLNVDGDTIVPFGKYSYIGHYNFGLAPAKKNNEKYVFIIVM